MIISHKYRFIFLKTRKTAGTSVEIYLSSLCGKSDVFTPIYPSSELHRPRNYKGLWNPMRELLGGCDLRRLLGNLRHRMRYFNHIPGLVAKCRTSPEIWNEYYKFCVERNPWDKTLSHYHMLNSRRGETVSVDDYIEKGEYCYNYPCYTDREGEVMVDRVVRYESLLDELGEVFGMLGVPWSGVLNVRAKGDYRKDRRSYRDVLSNQQIDMIGQAFSKEIALHGYTV